MFPVSFTARKFRLQIPLRPCTTPIGSFASQAQRPLLVRGGKYEFARLSCFAWCLLAALSNAPALPVLSKAGPAGLIAGESPEPSQSRAGSVPCSSGMGRDAHGGEVWSGAPAGKPILPVNGPLSGELQQPSEGNKENRSINSSHLP